MGGPVKNIRLSFMLDLIRIPRWWRRFEIDWIELTGVEELLQGEQPPPAVEYYFGFAGAGLFAPTVFYPIAPGIGEAAHAGDGGGYLGEPGGNVLTDLDGDGDLDSVRPVGNESS